MSWTNKVYTQEQDQRTYENDAEARRGILVDENGAVYNDINRLPVDAELEVSDIQIGAVEIKNDTTDIRANVDYRITTTKGLNTLPLGEYRTVAPSLSDTEVAPFQMTSDGKLFVDATISSSADTQIQTEDTSGVSQNVGFETGAEQSVPNVIVDFANPTYRAEVDSRDFNSLGLNTLSMGEYRPIAPTIPDNNTLPLQINRNGRLKTEQTDIDVNEGTYTTGSANLVKDTLTTVLDVTPPDFPLNFRSMTVSGEGLCEWDVIYGSVGSEVTIYHFWTTASSPTYTLQLQDFIRVDVSERLRIQAYNRETAGSPSSDFTGYATLVGGSNH